MQTRTRTRPRLRQRLARRGRTGTLAAAGLGALLVGGGVVAVLARRATRAEPATSPRPPSVEVRPKP